MIDMNVVYELIAEAKRKELQSVSTISVLVTTQQTTMTTLRLGFLKRVQLAKCTATDSKGVM